MQLLAVSIFALPNKSPPFRLSHFASEKWFNVYVLHFLDKQWLPEFVLLISVLNDRKKGVFLREFLLANKNIHNFLHDNTRFTPGIEAWSRATQKMRFRMDAGKIGDTPIKSDMKLGPQMLLGAESQSYGTIQLLPKSWKMTRIIPRRRGGTWEGVTVATWCSEWICKRRGGLVHHTILIPGVFSPAVAMC